MTFIILYILIIYGGILLFAPNLFFTGTNCAAISIKKTK